MLWNSRPFADNSFIFPSCLKTPRGVQIYIATSNYAYSIDAILKSSGVDTIKTPFHAPNANAHAERYVLNCRRDCLNHLLIFGLSRLQYVLDCYSLFYNEHRPHQGIGNSIPCEYNLPAKRQGGSTPSNATAGRNITRKDFLGGLLTSYQKAA